MGGGYGLRVDQRGADRQVTGIYQLIEIMKPVPSSFFDINAAIGTSAYGKPEFRTAGDLIRHMGYLQIDRSLVWSYRARDFHPVTGNRDLLDDIAEYRDRLIPAMVVTPANCYEDGAVEFLKTRLAEVGGRGLRIFPGTSRFRLESLERLLGELAPSKPALFWSFKDSMDAGDITACARLACQFPETNFVLTELMWGQFTNALHLLESAENIHIDISWLHMRDSIELLCRHFGPERVLFGTGYKAHYAAAIAMLTHCALDSVDREKIAHGNVERLLGLEPVSKPLCSAPASLEAKPVWKAFREGHPVSGGNVLDAHGHIGPRTRGWVMRDIEPTGHFQNLIRQMDDCGVERTIVAPGEALFGDPLRGNREAEEKLAPHQDRFSGFFCFNPHYHDELASALEEFFTRNFYVGLKILAAYWGVDLNDERYVPVWECAERHGLPILLHTWNDSYNAPFRLKEIAPKFPHAVFLLGHAGGGTAGRREAEIMAAEHPNVFLEFCGSFTTPVDWLETLEKVGVEKVVFGSDTDAHSVAWELGRMLSLPLPDAHLEPMLGANMRKILAGRRTR